MKIGFTQGTFDLFHVGHLNLLKRAKENCDYLIVGVNSDKLVKQYKKKDTIIKQNDRMAIIEALKVVDEVVLCTTLDKMEAWNKYHFDYIFIGNDWENSERWIKTEKDLQKVNSKVIYLPYTQGVSSTKIRKDISINEN